MNLDRLEISLTRTFLWCVEGFSALPSCTMKLTTLDASGSPFSGFAGCG
jgi:hypothetical protein